MFKAGKMYPCTAEKEANPLGYPALVVKFVPNMWYKFAEVDNEASVVRIEISLGNQDYLVAMSVNDASFHFNWEPHTK